MPSVTSRECCFLKPWLRCNRGTVVGQPSSARIGPRAGLHSAAWSRPSAMKPCAALVPADRELRGWRPPLSDLHRGRSRPGHRSSADRQGGHHCRARLLSDGKVAATLTGIYGSARATALSIPPAIAAGVRPAADLPDRPAADMGGPSFVQHFGTAGRKAHGRSPDPICAPPKSMCVTKIRRRSPNPTWWR